MQSKTLIFFTASTLLLCATAFVVHAVPANRTALNAQSNNIDAANPAPTLRRDEHHRRATHASPAVRATLMDLRAMERLYRSSGKTGELSSLYRDILAKTHNPNVRSFVYLRLARAQSAPANAADAIATLRQSLDENLARAEPKPDQRK